MEDWGEEIFAEGVGIKWTYPLPCLCTNPLPVKHPVTIQDGNIEPIYIGFRSEKMPALQASFLLVAILILLYSNFSGPKRYDLKNGSWIYTHDGACLHDLLSSEISLALGHEIDFTLLPYGGADENSP